MTATTDVVISEKSMLELASVEFSGIAVSRMSTMRMIISDFTSLSPMGRGESIHLYPRRLHHRVPARAFGLDALGEFRGRAGDGDEAERVELLLDLGIRRH